MLCILSLGNFMTDMIPRLSLPLRLKLSLAMLNYMNGHFSWKYATVFASLFMELYISAYFTHRTGVSSVQLKHFFFTPIVSLIEKPFEI